MSELRLNPIVEDEMRAGILLHQYETYTRERGYVVKKMKKIKNLDKIDQGIATQIRKIIHPELEIKK